MVFRTNPPLPGDNLHKKHSAFSHLYSAPAGLQMGWGQLPTCVTNQTAFCVAQVKEVGAFCRHIPQLRSPDSNLYTDSLTEVLKGEVQNPSRSKTLRGVIKGSEGL